MEVGLSYCFRLGNSLKRTNHLEMHSLQLLVKALWNFSWEDEDHEQQMVLAVYNILSTRFEPEEEENVEPTAFRDLEIMKESFIRRVFYEGDMREVAKLVRRTVELAQS